MAETEQVSQLPSWAQTHIKKLRTEIGDYRKRCQREAEIIKASNEARIERLSEQARGLVPTNYKPADLADWLNKNEAKIASL